MMRDGYTSADDTEEDFEYPVPALPGMNVYVEELDELDEDEEEDDDDDEDEELDDELLDEDELDELRFPLCVPWLPSWIGGAGALTGASICTAVHSCSQLSRQLSSL
jgi:hypothetical protein